MPTQKPNVTTPSDHFERGNDLYARGEFELAVAEYCQGLDGKDADTPALHNNLGLALCQLGRCEEGIVAFRQALALAPDDPDLLNNAGEALVELGRTEEAIEILSRAEEIAPEDGEIHAALGRAYSRAGQYRDALAEFKRAVELAPSDTESADIVRRMDLLSDQLSTISAHEESPVREAPEQQIAHEFLIEDFDAALEFVEDETAPPLEADLIEETAESFPDQDHEVVVIEAEVIDEDEAEETRMVTSEAAAIVAAARVVPLHEPVIEIVIDPGAAAAMPHSGPHFRPIRHKQAHSAPMQAKAEWRDPKSLARHAVSLIVLLAVIVLLLLYFEGGLNEYLPPDMRMAVTQSSSDARVGMPFDKRPVSREILRDPRAAVWSRTAVL